LLFLLERAGDLAGRNGELALATDILEAALDLAGGLDESAAQERIRERMGQLVGAWGSGRIRAGSRMSRWRAG
jgi:hypothetical protein